MLKFENTAEVGDVIKAFDFRPMPEYAKEDYPDSYLTGLVTAKGPIYQEFEGRKVYVCEGYTVKVLFSETRDEEFDKMRQGTEMFVPFEMSITDFDGRVTKFASKEEYEAVCYELDVLEA